MRFRSILTMLLAGALWVVVPASRALAQSDLPKEVVEATTLSSEQGAIVDKFVSERLPKLSDSDPKKMKDSRDELLRPLRDPLASVAFRRAYNDKMIAELRKLAEDKSDLIVVNALRIAGDIATSDSASVLEAKLNDKRPAVRYAAVSGLERTMVAVATANPAIPAERVESLLDQLGKTIKAADATPEVLDAATRALIRGMTITRQNFGNTRAAAFKTLSDSISALALTGNSSIGPVLLRAAKAAQEALAQNGPPLALGGESVKQAAGLGGQLLSWTYCQLKAGKLAPNEELGADPADPKKEGRKAAADIVQVSENVVVLAGQKAGVQITQQNLATDFNKGTSEGDQAFFRKLVGPILGPLNQAPFNFPDKTFLNCQPPK